MFRNLQPLILASQSPRRKRLLESVGIEIQVVPSDMDEPELQGATPVETARRLACLKTGSVSSLFPGRWVLGADTVVVLNGQMFGKPSDPAHAREMLQTLRGSIHEVITGICLENGERAVHRIAAVTTRVRFKPLADEEIEAYLRTGEPMDKAGAYGIQGIGAFLVAAIDGSYTNVVGLPLCEAVEWLLEEGIIAPV
ncbi:MAG: nucleoside triphosphate pyrophosphatase [Syntrophobacter sp.]